MKLLIINNLVSGYRDGTIYDFMRHFSADGDQIVIRSTDGTTDIRALLHDAERFDAVVASGGDGTVTTVSYALANTNIPVLPFPAGTANLLSLNLSSPNEPHALAKLVRTGKTLDFDLGELQIDGNQYGFGIMAGAGYDATIMKGAEIAKKSWGPIAYLTSAITHPHPQVSHFTLTLDGKTVESDGLGVLIINFSKIQFDISITHINRPRDGWFDVVVLKVANAFQLLPVLGAAIMDTTNEHPDRTDAFELHRAREVTVVSDPPLEIQFDGEVTNVAKPFTARILPKAARFIVSDEGYSMFSADEQAD